MRYRKGSRDDLLSHTVKRMQKWQCRVRADSQSEAREIADKLVADWPASDDYGYDTIVTLAKDQESEPDNAEGEQG